MKEKISVLVVDDNVEFCDLLRQYVNKSEHMVTVGIAKDGAEGLELINRLNPDVVILDIIMPNIDGIEVLERAGRMDFKTRPLFVVLSAVGQEVYTKRAMELGAEYYMVKPFDIEVLLKRIKDIYCDRRGASAMFTSISSRGSAAGSKMEQESKDIGFEVTCLMHEIGVPPHLSGHKYLREAILLAASDKNVFTSITRVLYPAIAEKFKSSPQKVERSIRNAIEATWMRESEGLQKVFKESAKSCRGGKPTNSQFIAIMAEKIRINAGINSR